MAPTPTQQFPKLDQLKRQWAQSLAAHRKAANFTQRQVANIVDVDQAMLSGWENGKRTPNDEMKIRLAGCFGVTVSALFPWPSVTPPIPRPKTSKRVAA